MREKLEKPNLAAFDECCKVLHCLFTFTQKPERTYTHTHTHTTGVFYFCFTLLSFPLSLVLLFTLANLKSCRLSPSLSLFSLFKTCFNFFQLIILMKHLCQLSSIANSVAHNQCGVCVIYCQRWHIARHLWHATYELHDV